MEGIDFLCVCVCVSQYSIQCLCDSDSANRKVVCGEKEGEKGKGTCIE